jgi:hypothetical protein
MPTLGLLWWETLCQSRPSSSSAEGKSERFVSIGRGALPVSEPNDSRFLYHPRPTLSSDAKASAAKTDG